MYTSTQRETPAGISSGSIDALRVELMKMNSQQLQAFAMANQDNAIKLGLAAEADKYKKQHGQEAMALMSGQQQKPPIAQQILQSIGQPLQQPQQPMPPQGQGMPPQGMPPQGVPPQGMPPQMAQGQMPPQGMADGGYVLPEDQGIATLPVGGMDFAEGGIVAFGGGGDVPGYAGSAGSYVDPLATYLKQIGMSPQEFIAKNGIEQQRIRAAAASAPVTSVAPASAPASTSTAAAKSSGLGSLRGAALPLSLGYELFYPSSEAEKKAALPYKLGAQAAVDEQGAKVAAAKETAEAYALRKVNEFEATLPAGKKLSPEARNREVDRLISEKIALEVGKPRQPVDPTGKTSVDPIKSATFKTDKDYGNQPAPANIYTGTAPANIYTGTAPPKSAVEPGLPAIAATKFERTTLPKANATDTMQMYEKEMPKDITDPIAKERQELNNVKTQAAARQVSLFEQEVQKRKPAFEDRLKALDEKEARVTTMADRNLNMALIEAGLAMMSGESPNAFVNIGKGAQVGVKAYAEGQSKIEAAKDKMEEARSRIEEFRRNEDMMTAKERRSYIRDYENTFVAAKELMFQGAKEAYGFKREDVRAAIATQHAREDANAQLASRENMGIAGIQSNENIARANMQNQRSIAAMPSAEERVLSNPALFDKKMQLITASTGMRGDTAYRETWAKSPYLQTQYPNINDYLRAMGVQPTVNLPKDAPVLP